MVVQCRLIVAVAKREDGGMTSNSPDQPDRVTARILRFERPAALRGRTPFAASSVGVKPHLSPVEDVEKYIYRAGDPEDERQRMITNAAASLVLITLIICGVWLTDIIIGMRDSQDCALSGRTNCAPIAHPDRAAAIHN